MATNGNNITVVLNAKDNASGVFKGLTGLIEGATLRANLLSEALSAGLSKGVSALTSKFKEAADIQLNNISAASTYAALTGRNFADAEKVFSNLDKRINQIASSLPGSTEEYKQLALGIQDNLIPAFVDANGLFNEGAFLDGLTSITRGMGFLGAASNLASKDVSKFTAKFLGGSSISELERLLFAESNPAFLSLVQKKLSESGKKLENLTIKERKQILEAVQGQLVTEDTIKAAGNSVSGLIESLKDKLFNPSQGIFGLLKDLDDKTEGNQSVLNAFNDTLKALLGDNGLFNTIGSVLNKLGIDPNGVLKYLKGGIENLNGFISNFNTTLTALDSSNNAEQLKSKFSKLLNFTDLGKNLGGLFNNGITYLQKLDLKALVDNLSHQLASSFNELVTFFETINYSNIAKLATNSLVTLYQGVSEFLISTDWGSRLGTIVNDAFKALGTLDWGNIFSGLGVVLANVLNTVLKFLEKLDTGAIFDTVISIIGGMFRGLGVFLANIDWTSVIEVFKKAFTAPIDILGKKIGSVIEEITYFLDGFLNKLTGRDDQSAKNQKVADIQSDPTLDNLQKARKIREIDHPTVTSKLNNYTNGLNVGSLMSAISREQKAAPAGAGIVIANSTEAILNRQQQSQLASSVGRGGGLNIGSIVIHAATNPEETAKVVMQHIADEWNNYNQNNLATAI
ncbi:hypothetical protein [Nostoc sp. 'Peltigera membranacea cyanobiont' N6]|uniref:hypothetical protein n=1 Tax=Nostoc sp. 'Peltigera membranacea cyanobiont' N6 TaxID=1261031 RepID=UPI000CF34287|nr:hypothetical protein [Nostoc sp. 'Peltigera membranacea cyanobiont' N6]AVH67031.1 hypothetical protein NPM_5599 [Nostoc sp. 'Peltigera membranacea cyanobiont' N6]